MVNNEERWKEKGNEWIKSQLVGGREGKGMGGGVDGDSDGECRSRRNLKPILWFDELRRSELLLKLSSMCSRMREVRTSGSGQKKKKLEMLRLLTSFRSSTRLKATTRPKRLALFSDVHYRHEARV